MSTARSNYCQKIDKDFVEQLNRKKPKTMAKIQKLWYRGDESEVYHHYSNTRYKTLNLHSFFQHGHYEIRCCNASLHAGVVRSQIVLALAINNAAMTKKYCSPRVSHSDNMRYSFRVWLLNLGLIGEEYKNCRTHLLKHLSGNIAWRHPEDAIKQRERLKQKRIAAREQRVEPVSEVRQEIENVTDNYRIDDKIKCYDYNRDTFIEEVIPKEGIKLEPQRLYLANTYETIGSKEYVTSLIGRSSVGRLGLFLQISADLGNLGDAHKWTLELTCVQPIIIYPYMIIGQVSFWLPEGKINLYAGEYNKYNVPQECITKDVLKEFKI